MTTHILHMLDRDGTRHEHQVRCWRWNRREVVETAGLEHKSVWLWGPDGALVAWKVGAGEVQLRR